MNEFKKLKRTFSILVVFLMMLSNIGYTIADVSVAEISTDKDDYEPGEVVLISGNNFLESADLEVTIERPDGELQSCSLADCHERFLDGPLSSDAFGSFADYQYDLNGIMGTYIITVTDGVNTAEVTFTDAITDLNLIYPEADNLILSGVEDINFDLNEFGSGTVYVYYSDTGCDHFNLPASTAGDSVWHFIDSQFYTHDGNYDLPWDTTTVPNGEDYCILIWDGVSGVGKDWDKSNHRFEVDNSERPIPECSGEDYSFEVDMLVMGDDCYDPNQPQDSVDIDVPVAGWYAVSGAVWRGNEGQSQTEEEFTVTVGAITGPVVEDDVDPSAITETMESLGLFYFGAGLNTVYMDTAAPSCSGDGSPNSVELKRLCLVAEPLGCEDDEDCDSLDDECNEGVCNEQTHLCEAEFIDEDGPVVTNPFVNPTATNEYADIGADVDDQCSNIESAKYYIDNECQVEGVSLDAKDGSFDELIEELEKTWANFGSKPDGRHDLYIMAWDEEGNPSNCAHTYFDLDTVAPDNPLCEQGGETGMMINGICNAEELLVCGEDPLLTAYICDGESKMQAAEYFIDDFTQPNWEGIFMDASDGAFDEACEAVEHVVDISQLEDGTHYLKIHGKDTVENWGKFLGFDPVSFIKDVTPPETSKEIDFAGEVAVKCYGTEEDDADVADKGALTNGCYYVKKGTSITLSAEDPDPQGTGEFAGDEIIHYKVWYKLNAEDAWELNQSGTGLVGGDVEITLNEDSYHLIEYWSEDGCANIEEHHFELDIVDTQAPEMWKEVGEPKILVDTMCDPEIEVCDYFINQSTDITFRCEDMDPHPVDDVTMHIDVYWKETEVEAWPETPVHTFDVNDNEFTFNCHTDSMHKFVYSCEDALGNEGEVLEEIDYTDTQAPESWKELTGESFECGQYVEGMVDNDDCAFVTQDTLISLYCEDMDPHPVGDVTIYYRERWKEWWEDEWDEWGKLQVYDEPFSYDEDSFHELEWYCVDALGNTEKSHFEIDIVDTQAPFTDKDILFPNVYWRQVMGGAERILNIQDSTGSWDWDVTNDVSPTGTVYLNIAGVTGQVLLDAYDILANPDYLAGAESTGDYLVAEMGVLPDEQVFNAFNIVFLQHLSDVTGDSSYADFAQAKMDDLINDVAYWKDISHPICGGDGCTAQELIEADETVIRSWSTSPSGIVAWDMYNYVEAAQEAGETSFANDMANEIDAYLSQPGYDNSVDYYELGLSAGILALEQAGMDSSAYVTELLAVQNADGSFGEGDEIIQPTAYALMALEAAGEYDAAYYAGAYLVTQFGYSGLRGWLEADGIEYSEVTSEASQALYDTMLRRNAWVTQNTLITLDCRDRFPHPSDNVTLFYRTYMVEDEAPEYIQATCGHANINWNEDSLHVIDWYCVDQLGNSEGSAEEPIKEFDNVDTYAPNVTKFVRVMKEGQSEFGDRTYSSELEDPSIVGVQLGDTVKFCAEVVDYKETGDLGVGVKSVGGHLVKEEDPHFWMNLDGDEGDNTYCYEMEITPNMPNYDCGGWHYWVGATDLLGNWRGTDGLTIVIDEVPPVGEVLNPHSGAWYADGKTFAIYAPAVDFGGDNIGCFPGDDDCMASGVDYCDFYAIDYNFEAMDQSEIKNWYQDLYTYFQQVGADPLIVPLGRVPYEDGVCKGYVTIPEESGLNDTVFLGVRYVDKAGNDGINLFGHDLELAMNPWFSPITMNIDNDAPDVGDITGAPVDPVKEGDYFTLSIEATDNDAGLFSCQAIFDGHLIPGVIYLGGDRCDIGVTVPGGLDDGSESIAVEIQDTQGNIEEDEVYVVIDNTVPDVEINSPTPDQVVGSLMSIDVSLADVSGVDTSTVEYRITDCWGLEFWGLCFGNEYDSGWRDLTLTSGSVNDGDYTAVFDAASEGLSSSGSYIFGVRACDSVGNCFGY